MNDYTKRYTLEVKNAIKFDGIISQSESEMIALELMEYAKDQGAILNGNIVMKTKQMIDMGSVEMEIFVPLDKKIPNSEKYEFIEKLIVENCIKFYFKGNPADMQTEMEDLQRYITKNHLTPKSFGYSVLIRNDEANYEIDDFETEIYLDV